jgi:maltose alpha-D-glucosyltransferase/alpha-amylase
VFLRNHDELTLEMVTANEREYLWNTYAADRRMRINLGIRRRLAPLMENDRRKIELMNALLLSMPGTPVVYYGDEIGMGDNIYLGDRDGVRTPMQWSPDRNGGFSRANPQRLYLPAIQDPIFGFQGVNVEAQQQSPGSLLNWMKRLITVRQARRTFGRGTITFLYPRNRKILAYLREFEGEAILCVFNLSRNAQAFDLDLAQFQGRVPIEMLGRTAFPTISSTEACYRLSLPGYAFYWFVLAEAGKPGGPEPAVEPCRSSSRSSSPTAGAGSARAGSAATSSGRCCPTTCPSSAGSRPRTRRSSACGCARSGRYAARPAASTC